MGLLLTPLYIPKIKELSEEVATLRSQVENASKSVAMANNHVNTNSNPKSKYDIFLSCKSEDYGVGRGIYDFLTSNGYSVFIADQELRKLGKDDYGKEIDKALEEAFHLVVIATNVEYLYHESSPYVYYEWHSFLEEKKCGRKQGNIITLLENNIGIDQIPYALRHCQSIKLSEYRQITDYVKTELFDDDNIPPKAYCQPNVEQNENLFYKSGVEAFKRNDNTTSFEDLLEFALIDFKDARYYISGIASRFRRLYAVPIESFDKVFEEANQGNAFALYLLSQYYACKEYDDIKRHYYAKLSAELGDSYGLYELGRCYQLGVSVQKDEKMHQRLLKKSISQNNPLATFNYIQDLIEGWSSKSNIPRALQLLNEIKKDYYGEKWFLLGQLYWKGKGVEKDNKIAEKYFIKAIECGLTTGYDELANIFMYDSNTSKLLDNVSLKKGYQYLLKGSEYNESACLSHIAMCNEFGIGVNKNIKNAIKWHKKAAANGDLHSFYRLAYIYFTVPDESVSNIQCACDWAKKGAGFREPRCMDLLGDICLLQASNEFEQSDALKYYEQAADYSNANSMLKLYYLYKPHDIWKYDILQESEDNSPDWIIPSKEKAFQYLRKSAERGNPTAMFIHGVILTDIEDELSDEILGVNHLKKALDKGIYKAANRLGFVYEFGIGLQQDIELAKHYYNLACQYEENSYFKNDLIRFLDIYYPEEKYDDSNCKSLSFNPITGKFDIDEHPSEDDLSDNQYSSMTSEGFA